MKLMIRPAQGEDFSQVEGLVRLELQLHAAHRPDLFRGDGSGYTRAEFSALLADPAAIAPVAEADGAVVGLCFGRAADRLGDGVFRPGRDAELEDLAVDPAFRRRGIAGALLSRAKEKARELGAVRPGLKVWRFNEGPWPYTAPWA